MDVLHNALELFIIVLVTQNYIAELFDLNMNERLLLQQSHQEDFIKHHTLRCYINLHKQILLDLLQFHEKSYILDHQSVFPLSIQ